MGGKFAFGTTMLESVEGITQQQAEEKILELIENGNTFHAYEKGVVYSELFPKSIILKQGIALALIRTGAVTEAKKIINPIYENLTLTIASCDPSQHLQIFVNLANFYKESWLYSLVTKDLEIARNLYVNCYKLKESSKSGVNVAALSWLIGEDAMCQDYSYKVIELHSKSLQDKNFLIHSHAGLSFLLLGDYEASFSWYEKALGLCGKGYAGIVEMRNALFFLDKGGFNVPEALFKLLPAPVVVVFTGPNIDRSDQTQTIFDTRIENFVRDRIKNELELMNAQIGYSSASCGSDILFVENMLDRGAEVNIILPFARDDFSKYNVRYAGPRWERRFEKVLEKANSVNYATMDNYLGHDSLYTFANQVMYGTAAIRAQFLFGEPHLVAIWNSTDSIISDNDFISQWADISTLHLIDLDEIYKESNIVRDNFKAEITPSIFAKPIARGMERIIKTMLFADFSGYSKLNDSSMPSFIKFLEQVSVFMEIYGKKVESLNTWGDAIFVVMNSASDLADYAMDLVDAIEYVRNGIPELSSTVKARISLHAGPVFITDDPFIKKKNYYGSHINRAARLEPVTVVGQVYATQQFVSMLNAEQNVLQFESGQMQKSFLKKFITEYVGYIALAKNFGTEPIYHLRRNISAVIS